MTDDDTTRLYGHLDALAHLSKEREIGAGEFPVICAQAAGMTIGANLAAGAITREDAERSIDALRDHMRSAAGLDQPARGERH